MNHSATCVHDAEILRHVFHHEKLKELKALFIQIGKKHLELKKEISETRLREDAIRREQDALEIEVSQLRVGSDDTSAGWNTVITRTGKSINSSLRVPEKINSL
jgi:hypothetical protein